MDTIAQMLTNVRNGSMAKLEKVDMPASKVRENIAKILIKEGFVRSFKMARDSKQGIMRIYLKYDEVGNPAFSNLSKVSTPGKRVYVKSSEIPVVRSGTGQCIISTNKGIMTGNDAIKGNLGGEILCLVW
ncbi:MAG: 30S ribosomal protein S8 [Bdellovibrio sp.]|nr:30S ribosomal protein S8 [Bdellovibrio sp.]